MKLSDIRVRDIMLVVLMVLTFPWGLLPLIVASFHAGSLVKAWREWAMFLERQLVGSQPGQDEQDSPAEDAGKGPGR